MFTIYVCVCVFVSTCVGLTCGGQTRESDLELEFQVVVILTGWVLGTSSGSL